MVGGILFLLLPDERPILPVIATSAKLLPTTSAVTSPIYPSTSALLFAMLALLYR